MKIFITGATGFIGSHLVNRLAQTSHEMICLVRPSSNFSLLKNLRCKIVTGDVMDTNSLKYGMKGCDWVVNLANVYSMWLADRSRFHKVNVIGTRNVMESALGAGASRVVHVSTAAVYGKPAELPFNEDSAPGPELFSDYAKTKANGDKIAWDLHKNKGLPLTMIYPGICLGAGDTKASAEYIKLLVRRRLPAAAFSDSVLTWVHVRDVAETIVKILEKKGALSEKYLVGNRRLSVQEFNEIVCRNAKVPSPVFRFPNPFAILCARILTNIANITKVAPMLGMSIDQANTMKQGFRFDGSRVEKDLEMQYSSVDEAIGEAVQGLK
jgi:dihydroflavonol-4-reductase